MLDATAEQWRAEVDLGLGMASLVGQKIILGGFSLGGALAIDALLRRQEIYGLVLFSPAIRLRSFASISTLACAPVARSYVIETDLPPNPVKYKYRVGNSVCQLSRLMEHKSPCGGQRSGNRLREAACAGPAGARTNLRGSVLW